MTDATVEGIMAKHRRVLAETGWECSTDSPPELKRAADDFRAAVEQIVRENLQRGNVIGRITAHLLGNKNNVTDEDVVIAAAEVGRELQGARERIERLQALVAPQEPVAWMVYTQDGKSVFVTDNPTDIPPNCTALPLFTESKA